MNDQKQLKNIHNGIIVAIIIGIVLVLGILIVSDIGVLSTNIASAEGSTETLAIGSQQLDIEGDLATLTSTSVLALNNSYLSFDGVDDLVSTRRVIFNFTQDTSFSYSLWVNPSVCGNGTPNYNAGLIGQNFRNALGINAYCKIVGGLRNSTYSGDTFTTPNSVIKVNTWNYIATSYNASTKNYSLYVNNIMVYNMTMGVTNITFTNESFGIGGRIVPGGNSVWYRGLIDEVRVYNRTLELTEIQAINNSGRYANSSLPSDGLVLWMPFEETNGTVVYDWSGNNNHGVLYG